MMADNTGDGIHSTGNRNSRPSVMINVSVKLNRNRLLRAENQEPRIHARYTYFLTNYFKRVQVHFVRISL